MRLFGYRITGVSLKFFILLFVALVAVVAVFTLRPSPPPPRNLLYEPAFPPQTVVELTSQEDWLGPYESSQELLKPTSASEFTGANFAARVGQPMMLQLYIPEPAGLEAYTLTALGNSFIPAYFINPTLPTSLENLRVGAATPQDPAFVVVGFPQGETPIPGRAYAVKALLWWRSDSLFVTETGQPLEQLQPVPVFLADDYTPLQPAQLRAPATHALDLELRYAEAGQELVLHRLEWAAGREVRLLMTLRNLTNAPMPIWSGVNAMTATLPQQASVAGSPEAESPLLSPQLEPQQAVTGYVTFPQAVADPQQELTLRMPVLQSVAGFNQEDLIIIRVDPDRVEPQLSQDDE